MIEWTKEQWSIIFLGLAVLMQWGIIINIFGKMDRMRRCIQILNKQNKFIKLYIDKLYKMFDVMAEEKEVENDD